MKMLRTHAGPVSAMGCGEGSVVTEPGDDRQAVEGSASPPSLAPAISSTVLVPGPVSSARPPSEKSLSEEQVVLDKQGGRGMATAPFVRTGPR